MSSIDWVPELAAALDELVPLGDSSRADWGDVVGRVGRRRHRWFGRTRPRRSARLVIVVGLLFLLLAGAATATYLLVRGNGDIAFGGGGKLLLLNPNGRGLRAVACPPARPSCRFFEPTWSPDGKRVAFLRGYGGPVQRSHISLYVAAAQGGGLKRLATCGSCDAIGGGGRLTWSPDGRWIAFSRDGGYTWPSTSLWVVAAGGGQPHRLTGCHRCADLAPAWSPNGRLILFDHLTRRPPYGGVYAIHPDGSDRTKILTSGSDFHFSPDGRRIVFQSRGGDIVVANTDGSHLHVVFPNEGATGPSVPYWSPDGRRLVFLKTPGRPGRNRFEVWTMNVDGSGKERLYRSPCCVYLYAPPIWSPDGRLIAFSFAVSAPSADGTYLINPDGTGLRRLSPTVSDELAWQALPKRKRP